MNVYQMHEAGVAAPAAAPALRLAHAYQPKNAGGCSGSQDGRLPFVEFRAFYNAAIDDSNGKTKSAKKPSAADRKRASMAVFCLASSKTEAHPLFPDVQPATSAELTDLSRRLRKWMVTHDLMEAEWTKLMALMDEQVPGERALCTCGYGRAH